MHPFPGKNFLALVCLLLSLGICRAEPTESRSWTSTAGTSIEAKATGLKNETVTLETPSGRSLQVALSQLSPEDQALLKSHFAGQADSAASEPGAFPYPTGEISGPIDAKGSHYYVYLPKSLKPGRKVPLIFFTHSGGGGKGDRLGVYREGAEICGWITAMSVESKNGMDRAQTYPHIKNCHQHLLSTLPIDPKRVYFTGRSGGSREAFTNAKDFDGAGVLAVIAGAQENECIRGRHYFFITGATDFNRYEMAKSFQRVKASSAFRLHPGGHSPGPGWLTSEGMVWLESQSLQKNKNAPERADFETAIVPWLETMKAKEPYRAAWWVDHFTKLGLQSSDARARIEAIGKECSATPESATYSAGLADIEKFSLDVLAEGPQYSPECMNHTSDKIQKKADELLLKHGNTPWIKEVFTSLKKKTGKL
ncbi:MAG: hypothetical protein QM627_03185 [Luteolibacter sp.]